MAYAQTTQVTFFTVKDSLSKIQCILQVVDEHIQKKEKICLVVPDPKALHFLDDLLWSHPKESFRPHAVNVDTPHVFVFLTTVPALSQNITVVFNLCPTPFPIRHALKLLYELEDTSAQSKASLFQKKFQVYQKAGCSITSGSIKGKKL